MGTLFPAVIDINFGVLVLLGIGVLGGALGAWFFQKIRIPQVVGYIIFGLIIGQSGFKLLNAEHIQQFRSFTWFALGIVGFLVGGELKMETFRQSFKQVFQVLFWQGILAYVFVAVGSVAVIYTVTGSWVTGIAAGVVFGAIATATDPASTAEVLWEYRSKGVLTTTIIAVIALDDAMAMTLYGISTSVVEMLVSGRLHLWKHVTHLCIELFGSVAFGLLAGAVLAMFLKYIHQKKDRVLAISIGMLLLVIGLTIALGLDVILVTMAMGMVLINLTPHHGEKMMELVKSFSVPIYVMFFVMVGARLSIGNMPGWLWSIIAVYLLGRTIGKISGCWLGGRISNAPSSVRHYCGLGILPQGGITIGLSILASQHLGDVAVSDGFSLGEAVVATATTTTLFVQLIGPSLVKLSIRLAGELGRNVTEDDVIASLTVKDAALRSAEPLKETDNISAILQRFSTEDNLAYPVVNAAGKLTGLLPLAHLKDLLMMQDCWDWMVAADVMLTEVQTLIEAAPLAEALTLAEETGREHIPVVNESRGTPAGILDVRYAKKVVQQELIRIQTQPAAV